MLNIKIQGHVDISVPTVEEATAKALEIVENLDIVASNSVNVLTKLYFIAPNAGVIVVAISEDDKEVLKVESQVLAVTKIKEYPLAKLPEQLVVYKEVIANNESTFSFDELMNVAQAVTDNSDEKVMPKQITITKVIDYRNDDPSTLVLNSAFGDNIFLSTDAIVSNNGDADAGSIAINDKNGVEYEAPDSGVLIFPREELNPFNMIRYHLVGKIKDGSATYIISTRSKIEGKLIDRRAFLDTSGKIHVDGLEYIKANGITIESGMTIDDFVSMFAIDGIIEIDVEIKFPEIIGNLSLDRDVSIGNYRTLDPDDYGFLDLKLSNIRLDTVED